MFFRNNSPYLRVFPCVECVFSSNFPEKLLRWKKREGMSESLAFSTSDLHSLKPWMRIWFAQFRAGNFWLFLRDFYAGWIFCLVGFQMFVMHFGRHCRLLQSQKRWIGESQSLLFLNLLPFQVIRPPHQLEIAKVTGPPLMHSFWGCLAQSVLKIGGRSRFLAFGNVRILPQFLVISAHREFCLASRKGLELAFQLLKIEKKKLAALCSPYESWFPGVFSPRKLRLWGWM